MKITRFEVTKLSRKFLSRYNGKKVEVWRIGWKTRRGELKQRGIKKSLWRDQGTYICTAKYMLLKVHSRNNSTSPVEVLYRAGLFGIKHESCNSLVATLCRIAPLIRNTVVFLQQFENNWILYAGVKMFWFSQEFLGKDYSSYVSRSLLSSVLGFSRGFVLRSWIEYVLLYRTWKIHLFDVLDEELQWSAFFTPVREKFAKSCRSYD